MSYVVYDVSGFLHSIPSGSNRVVNGFPVAGLEKLLFRLLDHQADTNILVLDPSGTSNPKKDRDLEGYKGGRDLKRYEIQKLEELLLTFEREMNVHVLQTPNGSDIEADDTIYSICKKLAGSNKDVTVYSDDIDMSACVVNECVTKKSISRPAPDVTYDNYTKSIVRDFVPHNMIAFYLANKGKKSDNIKADPKLDDVMSKCWKAIQEKIEKSPMAKLWLNYASEYTIFKTIVAYTKDLTDYERETLLQRAEYICCRNVDIPVDITQRRILNISTIYSALSALNSRVKPRNLDYVNQEIVSSVLQTLGGSIVNTMEDSVVDLSEFAYSEAFLND